MSIITYPLNNITYDATDAETYLCSRTSGVFSAEDCFKATATGSSRGITISKGLAWIKNDDFTGKSICNTDNVLISVPIADGNLPRIDRIVLRFSSNANASSIALKQGTPSSRPQAPAVSRTPSLYELALCDIRVPAGSIYVSQSDITSMLLDESVCGLMSDGVNKIPSQALLDKFQSDFDNWFKNIQEQLSGDVAANLQNQIDEINRTISSYDSRYILSSAKGTPLGVASLDGTGKVPSSQLPSMNFIPTSQKGNSNGVATLGSNGKVPSSELPIGIPNGIPGLGADGKIVNTYLSNDVLVTEKTVSDSAVVLTLEDNTEYNITFQTRLSLTVGRVNCHGVIKKSGTGSATAAWGADGGATGVMFYPDSSEFVDTICKNGSAVEFSVYCAAGSTTPYIIWHDWNVSE